MGLSKLLAHLQAHHNDTNHLRYTTTTGYTQSRVLLNMGVKVCDNCGHPNPFESMQCKRCHQDIFVVCSDAAEPIGCDKVFEEVMNRLRKGESVPVHVVKSAFTRSRYKERLQQFGIKVMRYEGESLCYL